jgi:sugar phosphate isomerase/epimerase
MTQLSMNEITTFRWSLEEDVEYYQRAGYSSIGVWRQKLADKDEEQAVELLAASDLSVSNLLWAGGFTGSDGRTFEESIHDATHALKLAAAIKAGCLVIYSGGRNNHTYRHADRLLAAALDELLPLAETIEVPLAIAPMHPACAADWTFLTSLDLAVQFIHRFQSDYLKLAYDTYHFPIGTHQRSALVDLIPCIGIVHLGDRQVPPSLDQEYCPLGQGRLPLAEIVSTLQDFGYSGAFDVKLFGPDIQMSDYWTLLEQSQVFFAELSQASAPGSLA